MGVTAGREGNRGRMTESQNHVARIATAAQDRGLTVATAESLTSGLMSSRLGAGEKASQWFCGGVIAYQEAIKFGVLDVREGPVVTVECAEQMARGVARLFSSDAAVSVTGVGGPDPSEGEDPGTVFVGVLVGDEITVHRLDLAGDDPDRILHETADRALRLLADGLDGGAGAEGARDEDDGQGGEPDAQPDDEQTDRA